MPRAAAKPEPSLRLRLVCGDDEFAVKQRAREIFNQWTLELPGADHEQIDAAAANSGEALRALGRLREAIDTLPFFGGAKAVWFKDCNFLGEERTAAAAAVTDAMAALADRLSRLPADVRCLISGTKPDRRRTFFKTLEKAGIVEALEAMSADDKDWAAQAETLAAGYFGQSGKRIADDALRELVTRVGPNARALAGEVEKLVCFLGDRPAATVADVELLTARQKHARAFALAEALGDRDLGRSLRCLDEELWEIRAGVDKRKSAIGLLYALIAKVRMLLVLKELARRKLLKSARDFAGFKAQLERLPPDLLPADRRFNPLTGNAYPVFLAQRQCEHYTLDELVSGLDTLLEANRRLVGTSLDDSLVLQQTLVALIGATPAGDPTARRAPGKVSGF